MPGQRLLGGAKDITPIGPGYYSFNWWLNRQERAGRRLFVDAPGDTIVASEHGGVHALWIIPSLDLAVSWNDSTINAHVTSPGNPNRRCNEAARSMCAAIVPDPVLSQ